MDPDLTAPQEYLPTEVRRRLDEEDKARPPSMAPTAGGPPSLSDAVAQRYYEEGLWEELIELYLKKLDASPKPVERAAIFKRIAHVFEQGLDDKAQAFDALVEAFRSDASDADAALGLERLATELGRWDELLDVAREMGAEAASRQHRTRELEVSERIVYWLTGAAERPRQAEPYVLRIAQLDPSRAVVHQRRAHELGALGAHEGQRDALERALASAKNDAEKLGIHLTLAELYAGHFRDRRAATQHFEGALAVDPHAMGALRGLERMLREEERFADLTVVLERQVAAAKSDDDRVDALMRLAELFEVHFVKPQQAAPKLERVLKIDPTRMGALDALERCYRAMRSWPELVRAMERRAELAQTKGERVDVMVRIAEVLEMKLDDGDAAYDQYRRACFVDPRDLRPVQELARLSERVGDWVSASTFRARLADLTTNSRAKAQIYVAIGELLAPKERNPARARENFEKALVLEPSNAHAWEAMQKLAEGSGDEAGRLFCLEQRAAHTETARQRAQLYVELATLRAARGDASGELAAFESALHAEPKNEAAAGPVLDAYVAEGRWDEAAPLCELIVAAALRDGDGQRAFDLLRLSTHIATVRKDDDGALLAARGALSLKKRDSEARVAFIDVCHRLRQDPDRLATTGSSLSAMVVEPQGLPPQALAQLGDVQRARGEEESATVAYEAALALDPQCRAALAGLADASVSRGEWARGCTCKEAFAETESAEPRRFELFIEAAELWLHGARDTAHAASAFERALSLRPRDHWLLHTLLSLYGQLEQWEKVAVTLRAIVDVEEDGPRKAISVYAMAQVVRDKLHDPTRAAELFEEVLELDAKRLDAFERIVRIYTEQKDWRALEASYRRMLARAREIDHQELLFALYHQLGLVYRDRLGDAEAALASFSAARAIKPDDAQGLKIVTELYVITDQLDKAIEETLGYAERDPFAPGPYSELYGLFLRQGSVDRAWCACDALAYLGEAQPKAAALTAEQARFLTDYPPYALPNIPGTLCASAWVTHLTHHGLDPTLTTILALMTPAIVRSRIAALPPQRLEALLGDPFGQARSVHEHAAVCALSDASEILGHPPPTIMRRSGPSPIEVGFSVWPTIILSPESVAALSPGTLAFLAGRRLAEQRPAMLARTLFASLTELGMMLQMAIRIARIGPKQAVPNVDAPLVGAMSPEERAGLREAVAALLRPGTSADLVRWSQLADVTASRAGLLLAGNLGVARKALAVDAQSPGDLAPRERMKELLLFALSAEYAELRAAIGISVDAPTR